MKASAPGKIILFGEHAVVYGRPALAVPITQVHADVVVSASPRTGVWIEAPDVSLQAEMNTLPPAHPLASLIHSVFPALGLDHSPNLEISISSTIPVASGLGSGAAVSVALIRALASFLGRVLTDEQVNALAYETEKLHHGTPSGIDNTVITYRKPVYFVKGRAVETFDIGRPFTIVIGDTGIPAPTKESVADVRKLWEADKAKMECVFDQVGETVNEARASIERGEMKQLGELMNQNHALLQEMTVSSPELDRLAEAARKAGALGAKLSGGGRGGNVIALAGEAGAETLSRALMSAGSHGVIISTVEP